MKYNLIKIEPASIGQTVIKRTGKADQTKKGGEKIRLLARLYAILRVLNDHPDGLTIIELSHYVKLPIATVRRIAESLEEQNYIICAPHSNIYRIGPTLALIGSNARPFDIANLARQMLMQVAAKTNESVHISVVSHGMAVVVDLIQGAMPMPTITTTGTSLPLYATAIGKALLASMTKKELKAFRNHSVLEKFTRNTITNWEDLFDEIQRIRQTGVAFDREEHLAGISGVAIPLKAPSGEIAALGMLIATNRYTSSIEGLAELLRNHPKPWESQS